MRFPLFAALVLCCSSAFGQISVQREVDLYDPIIATCKIPESKDTDVQITWRVSSGKVQYETLPGQGDKLFIWAPPGDHWLEATVASQQYRELLVLVPDPAFPDDASKAKPEKVKIALAFTLNRYTADFTVKGSVPNPVPPQPNPQPQPQPLPPLGMPSAEMQQLVAPIKAVMLQGDAVKAAKWREAWQDLSTILLSSPPPAGLGALKGTITTYANAVTTRAGLQNAFPGFSAALEKSFATAFGAEDGAYNSGRAIEFAQAVAWACSR